MTYDPRIHHRRSIRRGHDYRGGCAYFATGCVEGKECLFGRVVEGAMLINQCGQLVQRARAAIPQRFPSVIPDALHVMPNHWHGILVIPLLLLGALPMRSTTSCEVEPQCRT